VLICDDERSASTLQVWNLMFHQCTKPIFISQHSRSAIRAHRANIWTSTSWFAKKSHKPTHIICFGGYFQFLTEKIIRLYGTIMDIPNQCNKWQQFKTMAVLSNWREISKWLAFICEKTCSETSKPESAIQLQSNIIG